MLAVSDSCTFCDGHIKEPSQDVLETERKYQPSEVTSPRRVILNQAAPPLCAVYFSQVGTSVSIFMELTLRRQNILFLSFYVSEALTTS